MNWDAADFDWNQARAFLATAEEGSLSAAARALNVTQPTLSRQVSALEEKLGVTLFERGTRVMTLTVAGLELQHHVRAMHDAAMRVSLSASGQSQTIAGTVRIASTHNMACYHLPKVLAKIRRTAPDIQVEVTTANELTDLIRSAKVMMADMPCAKLCSKWHVCLDKLAKMPLYSWHGLSF